MISEESSAPISDFVNNLLQFWYQLFLLSYYLLISFSWALNKNECDLL